jgi:anti-anti-sigma factor
MPGGRIIDRVGRADGRLIMDVVVSDHTAIGAVTVTLRGQLDLDAAPRLQAALDGLRELAVNRVVVDLTDLHFCDSIGLSTFVVAHNYCTATGGYLRLAAPPEFMVRVLSAVGIASALPVYRTVPAALADDPQERILAAPTPPYL